MFTTTSADPASPEVQAQSPEVRVKFVKARRSEESNPGELVVNDEFRFVKMGTIVTGPSSTMGVSIRRKG